MVQLVQFDTSFLSNFGVKADIIDERKLVRIE